ncbi:glycosyl transferase family 1 [Demequina sediminis]|nr:glycosyl transferase family 1 [Demequina sediminis]
MHRFADTLARAYHSRGWTVVRRAPRARVSRHVRNRALAKFAAYVENLVVFPVSVAVAVRRSQSVHLADHSNALWLLVFPRRRATIVTCHDLIAVRAGLGEMPEHRTRWTGRVYQRLVLRGLGRAEAIHSVSHATATDITRLVGAAATTVHLPVVAHDAGQPVLAGPYLLIVSSSGWRKRRDRAVEVWRRLRDTPAGAGLRLGVVGPALTARELGESADLTEYITTLRDIDDATLFATYAGARALLQVSRYEGFGWPIVEANTVGTPAICTDDEVFREVAGTAGMFIAEDLDLVDWTGLARRLDAPETREAAFANSKRFGFEQFADGIVAIAQATHEGGTPRQVFPRMPR